MKNSCYITIGLSGCGKSTYAESLAKSLNLIHLSSDANRKLLSGDEGNQSVSKAAFDLLRRDADSHLLRGRDVIIDATFLYPKARKPFIDIEKLRKAEVIAVYFDVKSAICIKRNNARSRVVPEEVIFKQSQRLVPPKLEEGFDFIMVVND